MAEGTGKSIGSLKETLGDFSQSEFSPDEDDYKLVKRDTQQLYPEDYSDSESKITEEDLGYMTFNEFYKTSKITEHHSYHNTISGKEATEVLKLAPQKGYITRYSVSKKRYFLTIYCPSSIKVQHFLIAIDEEAPSYVLKGSGKSFLCIEELLEYYEKHPMSPEYDKIGISYSHSETQQWKMENDQKMKKLQEEAKKQETEEASDKQNAKGEQTYSQSEMIEMQQKLLDEQTNTMKRDFIEPLAQQQREYQNQIVQLQKSNQELLEYLNNKKKNKRHRQCIVQ